MGRNGPRSGATSLPDQEKTTVKLGNLPYLINPDIVLQELDAKGFRGKYDFLYLAQQCPCIALVNFRVATDAARCLDSFHDFTWNVGSAAEVRET